MKEENREDQVSTASLFERYVMPNYGRFPVSMERGEGCRIWDEAGKEYVDFGAGVAVCSLGHCHPVMTEVIREQAGQLVHCSNLYWNRNQAKLAEHISEKLVGAEGKSFFCNSGAEANEALIKLARRYGHATPKANGKPRFEIITFEKSFHGRTVTGISATAQEKVKTGFAPLTPGFVHVPFNDLDALGRAITPETSAVLLEVLQGEGGIRAVTPDFLAGVSALCAEHRLLLLLDEVQCGIGRTGELCSWKSIEGGEALEPDAVSWAKGMAGGYPFGAIWIRSRPVEGGEAALCDLLGPGSHGATFGGNPLGSAVALAVLEEIQNSRLWENCREQGEYLRSEIASWKSPLISEVRGLGLMIGIEFGGEAMGQIPEIASGEVQASLYLARALMGAGLLTVPAGANVVRFLPPMNVNREICVQALAILRELVLQLETETQSTSV